MAAGKGEMKAIFWTISIMAGVLYGLGGFLNHFAAMF
jgi:hypothetical protein